MSDCCQDLKPAAESMSCLLSAAGWLHTTVMIKVGPGNNGVLKVVAGGCTAYLLMTAARTCCERWIMSPDKRQQFMCCGTRNPAAGHKCQSSKGAAWSWTVAADHPYILKHTSCTTMM